MTLDSLITSNRARAEKATPTSGRSSFTSGSRTISFGTDYEARPFISVTVEGNEYGYINSWQEDADGNYTGVTIDSSNNSSENNFQFLIVPNNQ